eukprot:4193817-Prymnesium_polylepis.1
MCSLSAARRWTCIVASLPGSNGLVIDRPRTSTPPSATGVKRREGRGKVQAPHRADSTNEWHIRAGSHACARLHAAHMWCTRAGCRERCTIPLVREAKW